MRFVMLVVLLIACCCLLSETLTVALDGSQDFTSVQAAVDTAGNGDTVLVYPGTYYENIVIDDKFITLASLNYTTGEEQYIHSTILDGNFSGSVVRMVLETSPQPADAIIQGFTIIHGSGYASNPVWPQLGGGGVYVVCGNYDYWIDVEISNCQVKYNKAEFGAGIRFHYWGNLYMRNVSIHDNAAWSSAAGISINYSSLITYPESPCNFYDNIAATGHDITIANALYDYEIYADTLTTENPYPAYTGIHYDDHISPEPQLILHHNHWTFEETDADLYVSPGGDDTNSGLSPANPLRTIRRASYMIASNPVSPRSIYLESGVYTDLDGSQEYGVGLKSHVSLIGTGSDMTFLETYNAPRLLHCAYADSISISGLTLANHFPVYQDVIWSPYTIYLLYCTGALVEDIHVSGLETGRNPSVALIGSNQLTLRNAVIENNEGYLHAGLLVIGQDVIIEDCIVRNNNAIGDEPEYNSNSGFNINVGGNSRVNGLVVTNNANSFGADWHRVGVFLNGRSEAGSHLVVSNSLFADNVSPNDHTFFVEPNSGSISFVNCTFVGNQSEYSTILVHRVSDQFDVDPTRFINCVFYDETAYEFENDSSAPCAIEVDYSLVNNGIDGIYSPNNEVFWGDGNHNTDPLLLGEEDFYYPMEGSPLINAGTPDTTGLCLPPHDLMHRARVWDGCIDIGCHEYGSVGVTPDPEVEDAPATPLALANYPNPFNPWTRITYSLPEAAHVRLSVYNIRGQRVTTLVDEHLAAGEHSAVWDGRDERMNIVAGGVYLLRLQAGDRTEVRKVLMVK